MIDFTDNLVPEITYAQPIQISKGEFVVAHGVSTEDPSPVGLTFSRDGMKMFVVGNSNNTIIECDLTTPYAINTAVPTGITYSTTFLDEVAVAPESSECTWKVTSSVTRPSSSFTCSYANNTFALTPVTSPTRS